MQTHRTTQWGVGSVSLIQTHRTTQWGVGSLSLIQTHRTTQWGVGSLSLIQTHCACLTLTSSMCSGVVGCCGGERAGDDGGEASGRVSSWFEGERW